MEDLNKTASFFVKDLLTARKVDNYFVQKGVKFISVHLCGVITSSSWSTNRDKLIYIVDDGTACINCYLEHQRSRLTGEIENNLKTLRNNCNINSVLAEASLITATSSKKLLNKHVCEDLVIGDTVKIIGKLRQYTDFHYIFIDKIEKKISLKGRDDYLRTLFYLYKHIYQEES